MMNLEYLRTYLELISLGSFSEVARKLSISQPAVSFQIQKLEQELGARLIDRQQKTLSLTVAGQRLRRFAENVTAEYSELVRELQQLREEVIGNLIITASTIPGDFILPPLLSEFKKINPAVEIQVVVSDSRRVIEGVRNGAYEVGFCGLAPETAALEAFPIGTDEIVLIVYPEHPLAGRDSVSFAELTGESLIFREDTSGTQLSVAGSLRRAGFDISRCKPALVLGTTEAVVSAVEAGSGIAFVSNLAIKKSVALGLVKAVAVAGVDLKRDFWCLYRKEGVASRLLEEFVAYIRERAV